MNDGMKLAMALAVAAAMACSTSSAPEPVVGQARSPHLPVAALSWRATGSSAIDDAIRATQDKLKTEPTVAGYNQLAVLMMRKKRETAKPVFMFYAEDAVRAARTLDPDDTTARLLEAMVYQDQHRFRAAHAIARDLTALRPSDPTPYLVMGDALLELGRYEEATAAYQAAMDLRPDLRSYNRGAYMRWLYGDFQGAVELIEYALDASSSRDPESIAWCFVDLGNMYWHRGDTAVALRAAARALEAVPGYVPALSLEARTYAAAGDDVAAAAAWEQAIATLPTTRDLADLADAQLRLGRTRDAERTLERAVRLAEHDPRPVALYYARHRLDPEQALRWSKAELHSRRNVPALDTHALVLFRHGRLDEAEKTLRDAMVLGTPDASLWLHLALIQAARDDEAAGASFKRALEINPRVDPLLVGELRNELQRRGGR